MSSVTPTSRDCANIVLCDCGLKARFAQAKSEANRGRLYYGCPNFRKPEACDFFRWLNSDDQLHAETSGTSDAMDSSKSHRQHGLLEHDSELARRETHFLKEENKVLRRMALREGLGDHAILADGEIVFKRRDAVFMELHRAHATLKVYKYLLLTTWMGFILFWAFGRKYVP